MKIKNLAIFLFIIFGLIYFGYNDLVEEVSSIDIFNGDYSNETQMVNYTENELMDRIIYELSIRKGEEISQVNKIPYGIKFKIEGSPYKITHVTEHNKELENEIDKPLIRIERQEGRSNWDEESVLYEDAITILNILAPSLTKLQLKQITDNKIDLPTQSAEFDDLIEVEFSKDSENEYIAITKEYGEFIDASANPLTEAKQPNQLFSLNYKQGDYIKYTSDIWINQLVAELNDILEWEITMDEVYKSDSDYTKNLYLVPNKLNDGYTKYIEISTSNYYTKLNNEMAVPSVTINIERVWQSDEEQFEIFSAIVSILDSTLSNEQIEKAYSELNRIGISEELEFGSLEVNLENSSLKFQKDFVEEISSGIVYNLAFDRIWIDSEESLYDDLIAIKDANYPNRFFDEPQSKSYSYRTSSSTTSNNSTSTSSSTNTTSSFLSDEVSSTIQTGIVTVVKNTVSETEGFSSIDWPWSFDAFNIKSLGGDMYTTQGNFSHNGYVYNFELIIMMRPDTSGRIEYYNVY